MRCGTTRRARPFPACWRAGGGGGRGGELCDAARDALLLALGDERQRVVDGQPADDRLVLRLAHMARVALAAILEPYLHRARAHAEVTRELLARLVVGEPVGLELRHERRQLLWRELDAPGSTRAAQVRRYLPVQLACRTACTAARTAARRAASGRTTHAAARGVAAAGTRGGTVSEACGAWRAVRGACHACRQASATGISPSRDCPGRSPGLRPSLLLRRGRARVQG